VSLIIGIILILVAYGQTSTQFYQNGLKKVISGDYRGSIVDFTKSIELNQKDSNLFYQRGYSKSLVGDYKGAILDYSRAIELGYSDLESAFSSRGSSKAKIYDYRGAIADYTKAIEIEPNNYLNVSFRGDAKNALNDYRGAISDYNKALELIVGSNKKQVIAGIYSNRGAAKGNLKDYTGGHS
jgi:tetratricopeptide (TPR) repeat protein